MESQVQIFPDLQALSGAAAEMFVATGNEAIEKNGRFAVSLAGGSTPKALYRLLAAEFVEKLDWQRTFFFFGDERFVARDAAESNFRMANENLFASLKISAANVFRWRTELVDAEAAARDYERRLRNFFQISPLERPRFDFVLLGMGADGHTASLFPQTAALAENERLAVANRVEKLDAWRLTLTFPVFNNAARIAFLVAGADKAETLQKVLRGAPPLAADLPSQNIRPKSGDLVWLLDGAAAALLDKPDAQFTIPV
jgi:6-phosphogluconolactonase